MSPAVLQSRSGAAAGISSAQVGGISSYAAPRPQHNATAHRQRLCRVAVTGQDVSAQQPFTPASATPSMPRLINMDVQQPGVTRRQLIQGGTVTAAFATCACCAEVANAEEWDYGDAGPNLWDGACATGTRQSPVNLPLTPAASAGDAAKYTCKFGEIQFKYNTQERVVVMNTGHGTMQVNFKPGNIATIGGVDLELLQYHFHTPSEHAMDGKRAPMEVHLVHKVVATGGLAVIGVMMESGATIPNPSVQTAYVFAPTVAKQSMQATRPLDPWALLPADNGSGHRPYIHYAGSLTTPPCSEGVDWFVLTQPIKVTDKQILDFMKYVGAGATYGQNSRPVQPLHERKFKYEL